MLDDGPGGRAGRIRDRRGDDGTDGPADDRAEEGNRSRLREGLQLDLPPACPGPEQAAAGLADVVAERRRGEHGEGQEQGACLAAEEQQPPRCDPGRRDGCGELVGGRRHLEAVRPRGELRPHVVDLLRVGRDAPRVHVTRKDR